MKLHEVMFRGRKLTVDSEGFLDDFLDIKRWLYQTGVSCSFDLHMDKSVSVTSDLTIMRAEIDSLPVRIKEIGGSLILDNVPITALRGLPESVGKNVVLNGLTKLESLEGVPSKMRNFKLTHCHKITSLVGIADYIREADTVTITPKFILEGGLGILSIKNIEKLIVEYSLSDTENYPRQFEAFKIITAYLDRLDDIFECQAELIDKGLEEFATL